MLPNDSGDLRGHSGRWPWHAIGFNFRRASRRPVSRPYMAVRRDAARLWRVGAGRRVSFARSAVDASTASLLIAISTAGTIFDSTKVALTTWFRAMYLITQTKQGISSIELGRRLGTTQTTAWKIKTKLAEVMRRDGEGVVLNGRIEMDDVFLGDRAANLGAEARERHRS